MQDTIYIVKTTGEKEEFVPQKLRNSLTRAGARKEIVDKIMSHIKLELKDGMSTQEIYRHAFDLLKTEHKPSATRYSIRNAVMDLGPTGFPFEHLIEEIFKTRGFETSTEYILQGKCAEHEIDITAWNDKKLIFVEAKFHNQFGIKSDIKTVLYVNSRWQDLADTEVNIGEKRKMDEGWLVTNTKFSSQAIKYAECRNMKLVGWNYPVEGNLQDLIVEANLHPITSIENISGAEKRSLLESGIILCKQALENQDIVKSIVGKDKFDQIIEEIRIIQNEK